MRLRRFTWLAPLAATLTAGCFATRNDIRLLKADIVRLNAEAETARKAEADRLRAEQARRDSMFAAEVRKRDDAQRHLMDSIRALADDFSRYRASQAVALNEIQTQISTVQEIVGVTQQQIRAQTARREAQLESMAAGVTGDSAVTEGPRMLYQVGMDQLGKGAFGQARNAFQEVVDKFPNDTLVPDALYQIGVAFNGERQDTKADSVWASILRKYPKSDRAPGALYKRAFVNQEAGRHSQARTLYQQVIKDFPASDEARRARVQLTTLPDR